MNFAAASRAESADNGAVRGFAAVVALLAMASTVRAQSPGALPPAQPQPQPPAQPQPAPVAQPPAQGQSPAQPQPAQPAQPQPAQPAQPPPAPVPHAQAPWYRLTLNDGRVVDVQIVGGDATNYHVVMAGTVYSLPRANVVSSVALVPVVYTPQAPAAPPPPPPPAQVVDDNKDPFDGKPRTVGGLYFGVSYLTTVAIALAKRDDDPDAVGGLVPVVGPLLWTLTNDDNDAFEDGWDWLAALDTLMQGMGLYLMVTGTELRGNKKTVRLHPMTGRNQHGFAISGAF